MATRKEEKAARREERMRREAEAAIAARRRRRVMYLLGALGALAAVALIVALIASSGGGGGSQAASVSGYPDVQIPARKTKDLAAAAKAAGCFTKTFPSDGAQHVGGTVSYKTNPPTSGSHNPNPAGDGVFTQAPAKEAYVHSLEHGRVELQFKPDAPAQVRGAVKAVSDESPDSTLVFPNNTSMPYEVAATAWTHLLACPRYNTRVPDALRAFGEAYRGKGPENVP